MKQPDLGRLASEAMIEFGKVDQRGDLEDKIEGKLAVNGKMQLIVDALSNKFLHPALVAKLMYELKTWSEIPLHLRKKAIDHVGLIKKNVLQNRPNYELRAELDKLHKDSSHEEVESIKNYVRIHTEINKKLFNNENPWNNGRPVTTPIERECANQLSDIKQLTENDARNKLEKIEKKLNETYVQLDIMIDEAMAKTFARAKTQNSTSIHGSTQNASTDGPRAEQPHATEEEQSSSTGEHSRAGSTLRGPGGTIFNEREVIVVGEQQPDGSGILGAMGEGAKGWVDGKESSWQPTDTTDETSRQGKRATAPRESGTTNRRPETHVSQQGSLGATIDPDQSKKPAIYADTLNGLDLNGKPAHTGADGAKYMVQNPENVGAVGDNTTGAMHIKDGKVTWRGKGTPPPSR